MQFWCTKEVQYAIDCAICPKLDGVLHQLLHTHGVPPVSLYWVNMMNEEIRKKAWKAAEDHYICVCGGSLRVSCAPLNNGWYVTSQYRHVNHECKKISSTCWCVVTLKQAVAMRKQENMPRECPILGCSAGPWVLNIKTHLARCHPTMAPHTVDLTL